MVETKRLEDLASLLIPQVKYRDNNDAINLLWKGYLAALMVEGFLTPDDYHSLNNQLKPGGEAELQDVFRGHPGQFD